MLFSVSLGSLGRTAEAFLGNLDSRKVPTYFINFDKYPSQETKYSKYPSLLTCKSRISLTSNSSSSDALAKVSNLALFNTNSSRKIWKTLDFSLISSVNQVYNLIIKSFC